MSEERNKGGRPTLYKPEYCEMIIEFMGRGFSKEAFAGHLKISKNTLYEWIKSNAEFQDAAQIAEERCRVFWEEAAISQFTGELTQRDRELYKKHIEDYPDPDYRPPLHPKNFTAHTWKFNMMNRFPSEWRDRKDLSLTGADGGPIQIANPTDKLKELIKDKEGLKAIETLLSKLDKPSK